MVFMAYVVPGSSSLGAEWMMFGVPILHHPLGFKQPPNWKMLVYISIDMFTYQVIMHQWYFLSKLWLIRFTFTQLLINYLFAQHELFRVHQPCIHLVQVPIHTTIPMLTT